MKFEIIRLQASSHFYEKASEAPDIPIGQSRIGGPIVDLPDNFEPPDNLYFIGILDLNWLSQYDGLNLLPESGYLLFFYNWDGKKDVGLIHYYDGPKEKLRRLVKEHEGWFWQGTTIESCLIEQESLEERYNEKLEKEFGNRWDYFVGMEKTKLYGIHSNPQLNEADIIDILKSNWILLLQIGEDITEEGTLSFFVTAEDLKNRNFSNCKAVWAQT